MMKGVKSTFYVDKVEEIDVCDESIVVFTGGFYEKPYPVIKPETDHNLENCNSCRKHHELLVKEFKEQLNVFPNCCTRHSKLNELNDFNINDYEDAPLWAADKIMFSYHQIIQHIDSDNWYEEITNYIDYCILSYGCLPPKYGLAFELGNYFSCLLHLIKPKLGNLRSTDISVKLIDKRLNKVISYLESYFENQEQKSKNINLLLSTYNDWYKLFPFELSYFKHLKEKFKLTLPIFNSRKRYNSYLKTTVRELHTKESLIKFLTDTTSSIISNINGFYLFENGKLSNTEKIQLDLILANRKLELDEINLSVNKTKYEYIKTLKKWFKTEKQFLKEIEPLINKKPERENTNTSRPNRTDIAYCIFYLSETKTLLLENPFPSDKAWKEIGEKYDRNWKNIQTTYNVVCLDRNERLKKKKKRNLSYVVENMLQDCQEALKLAKDELKLIELNS
ncbi:hypothetical protein [uncultured Aquimarina sp.]|uniref:hypothetical protein n=1 Tax=uncultured Aquimarina sp. TaxID=575652 RepID=UPI0026073C7E|nr:hypothetical protein [uncultured Aquimarina sp.]